MNLTIPKEHDRDFDAIFCSSFRRLKCLQVIVRIVALKFSSAK